jgi:hypothetical protein
LYSIQKQPKTASQFIRTLSVNKNARTCILHTRFGTQGSELDNRNNHPIPVGNIIGVHNGCISNDWSLFRYAIGDDKRIAKVDSEAIFSLINYGVDETLPNADPDPEEFTGLLEMIGGSAAIAWMDRGDRTNKLHLARLASSPLVIGETKNGSFLFASEEAAIKSACEAVGLELEKIEHIACGYYFTVVDGAITTVDQFEPYKPVYSKSTYSSGPRSAWTNLDDDDWDRYNPLRGTGGGLAVGELEKADQDNSRFVVTDEPLVASGTPHLNPFWLNPKENVRLMDAGTYANAYRARERAITDWFENLHIAEGEAFGLWYATGADLRPGDWVTTEVYNNMPVFGQIARLPDEFPGGAYIVRAYLPNSDREQNYEVALLTRTIDQFEVASNGESAIDEVIEDQLNALADIDESQMNVHDDDEETPAERFLGTEEDEFQVGEVITLGGKDWMNVAPGEWRVVEKATIAANNQLELVTSVP